MLRTLGVEDVGGAGMGGRPEVRLRLLPRDEPLLYVGDASVGDRVTLPLGAAAGLGAVDDAEAVLQQAGHRRGDLAAAQGPAVTELLVEGPLRVATMARTGLQESQEGVTYGHAQDYTHHVYMPCIRGVYTLRSVRS